MDELKLECQRLNSGGCRPVDRGRPGWLDKGLQQGGPADRATVQLLNRLLGQAAFNPCLEFTLDGGQWLLSGKGQITLGGADMQWQLNGQRLQPYSTLELDGAYELSGTRAVRGARSYLAVRGIWFGLPQVWHSCSPGAPGIVPCQVGDAYQVTSQGPAALQQELNTAAYLPELPLRIPVQAAPEFAELSAADRRGLLAQSWQVSPSSNRQGLRLLPKGQHPEKRQQTTARPPAWSSGGYGLPARKQLIKRTHQKNISSPVLPGTVQLTPNGPILLFRDAQTVGGYSRALITAADRLDLIGQLRPGDELYFSLV
ncbi:MAG: hypothetical protein AAF433_09035 [Bacteroidota bacterium]